MTIGNGSPDTWFTRRLAERRQERPVGRVGADQPATALMPHSQVIVYENAPHGLYLSHGDRPNQDLLEFVAAGAASLPGAV